MISIRRELQKSLMIALLIASIMLLLASAYGTLEEINELFDAQLRQTAQLIQQQEDALHIAHVSGAKGLAYPPGALALHKVHGEREALIQIWDTDGTLLYSSHPAIPYPDLKATGLVSTVFESQQWRSYSVRTEDDIVQVSQPMHGRARISSEIAMRILVPVLMLFPILGLFSWYAVRRGLAPINTVSAAIGERTPASLVPISQENVPEEILPLVGSLNNFINRLDNALKLQRQFTADAAHELRTPLTAIQLQLQVMMRAQTEEGRAEAELRLSRGVRRAIDLVQKLLTFTRVEPEGPVTRQEACHLNALVTTAYEQFADVAADKTVTLTLPRCDEAAVLGDADNLQILLNNLVDNAIRYTPEGGHVELSLALAAGFAVFTVTDDGIGVPEAERERIFDRFYRVVGTRTQGTGLGLAIVREIAERHGATLKVSDGKNGSGTTFAIKFPLFS
ncbi:MAG: ATP-binding protein [Micavibrio sp.]|nr:ATP-binding protein [Micavibrio sp.]